MPVIAGRKAYVYRNTGSGWNQQFVFFAHTATLTVNPVDATTHKTEDGAGMTTRGYIAGVRECSISGRGRAHTTGALGSANAASWMADTWENGTDHNLRWIYPNYGRLTGYFLVSELSFDEELEGASEFSATFVPSLITGNTTPTWQFENPSGTYN